MQIPGDKKFFRIGEVSRILGVEPYVLRYWEGEFPQIRPLRADSNQRTYQRKDLEILFEVKRLLYEERMTIEGAKQRLKQPVEGAFPQDDEFLSKVKRELEEVLAVLKG
ncbi:MAG: MerR family transcriptional regulator [Deltaproteobacteria bacterium]|nr:MerR family transcriptional regulator [Deltaproteobacteria bacterium]